MSANVRFSTLDALRGVAAVAVMIGHTPGHPLSIPGYYLAVDLFFGLSGFVIALTYEDQLRADMTAGQFMALRAARLWPMVFLGSLPGVIVGGGWMGTLFLIPDLRVTTNFPADPALWSLEMEMIAYLVFALIAPRIHLRGLVSLMAVCGLTMIVAESWLDEPLARVCYSFTCGVALYRLRQAQGLPRITSARAWLLAPATVCLLFVPGQLRGLLVVLFALPCLLWLATKWEVPNAKLADRLGALSYPLYCSHMPLLAIAAIYGLPMPVLWLMLLALSLLFNRWWDRPMRNICRGWVEEIWSRTKISRQIPAQLKAD